MLSKHSFPLVGSLDHALVIFLGGTPYDSLQFWIILP